jgi:hypothetical protein
MLDDVIKKVQGLYDKYGNSLSLEYSERKKFIEEIKTERNNLGNVKKIYRIFLMDDEMWLKKDLEFYKTIQKPEVKELYKNHIEWQMEQLEVLKDKLKIYD